MKLTHLSILLITALLTPPAWAATPAYDPVRHQCLEGGQVTHIKPAGALGTCTDLRNADLRGANLQNAKTYGATFNGAIFDVTTRLPFSEEIALTKGMIKM